MTLAAGRHLVPNGYLAAVVTSLEMTAPFFDAPPAFPEGVQVGREIMTTEAYQNLFRAIGTPWLWQSRLLLDHAALNAILQNKQVETWVLRDAEGPIGLVELDFRTTNSCELAFFGLIPKATGNGLGRSMMALAQTQAFAHPISRLHLHTCTLDSPQALGFYGKSGFRAYRREIEIFPDPRLHGTLPKTAATHIPCL